MRAMLLPKIVRPGVESVAVEMLARTGGRRIKVQADRGRVFAVDRWRLHAADGRRRVSDEEFDALPWQGSGPDPRGQQQLAPAGAPVSRVLP